MLSEDIGVDIKLTQTEANVGKFSVDILAEEESSGRKIIIENQLEGTNHDHLGKIITYASGYGAEIIIWIVRDYREEHQKAVDWLNEHTDEYISFFLIRIELWQIGESNPAPKFEIVVIVFSIFLYFLFLVSFLVFSHYCRDHRLDAEGFLWINVFVLFVGCF